jgi:photosystem II stability/assembly factor-like uncharacterized protein
VVEHPDCGRGVPDFADRPGRTRRSVGSVRRRTVTKHALSHVAMTAVVVTLAACGQDAAPISFDTVSTETTAQTPADSPLLPSTSVTLVTLPADSAGDSWEDATGDLAGLASECGNLQYVSARPDRRGLISGVSLQGIWSSEDGGDSWTHLGEGAGSDEVTLRLTDVQYDPEDPTRFWISGLYNGGGVYRTDDDGDTFHQLGDIFSLEDVGIDFTDPQRRTLVAAGHETIEVQRSRDGGETWASITDALPREDGQIEAVEVIDADTYVIGTQRGPVPGIFRTVDAGENWERVYTRGVVAAPVKVGDELIWLIERGGGLVISDDGGATWTEVPSSAINPFARSLTTLPDGRLVTTSARTLIASADRGISWRPIGPGLPFEPWGVLYAPFEQAFFIWRFDCELGEENPIRSNAIMRLDFEPGPV